MCMSASVSLAKYNPASHKYANGYGTTDEVKMGESEGLNLGLHLFPFVIQLVFFPFGRTRKAHFADENGRDSIPFCIRPNIAQRNFPFSQSNYFSLVSSAVQLTNTDTIQMKFSLVRGLSPHLTRNLSELRLNTLNFSPQVSLIGWRRRNLYLRRTSRYTGPRPSGMTDDLDHEGRRSDRSELLCFFISFSIDVRRSPLCRSALLR